MSDERTRTHELRKYALIPEMAIGTTRMVGSLVRKHPAGTVAGAAGAGIALPDTAKAVKNTFKDRMQQSVEARMGLQRPE